MTYFTIQGDTWDIISLKFYADEAFVSALIEANPGHANTVIFSAGVILTIPVRPEPSIESNLPPWRRMGPNTPFVMPPIPGPPGRDGKDGIGKPGRDGKDGNAGPTGKDAYEMAVSAGYTGTREDYEYLLKNIGNIHVALAQIARE